MYLLRIKSNKIQWFICYFGLLINCVLCILCSRQYNTLYEYNWNSMLAFGGDAKRENKRIRIQKKKIPITNYMQKLYTQNVHCKQFHVSNAYRWLLTSVTIKVMTGMMKKKNQIFRQWMANFLSLIFQINAQNERVRVTIHWCAPWWNPLTHAERTQCARCTVLLYNWFTKIVWLIKRMIQLEARSTLVWIGNICFHQQQKNRHIDNSHWIHIGKLKP